MMNRLIGALPIGDFMNNLTGRKLRNQFHEQAEMFFTQSKRYDPLNRLEVERLSDARI